MMTNDEHHFFNVFSKKYLKSFVIIKPRLPARPYSLAEPARPPARKFRAPGSLPLGAKHSQHCP
jgi:hypothetical protein